MYKKNTAGKIYFTMISASTGVATAGVTVTAKSSIDGAAQATPTGSVSDLGNGQYVLGAAAGDLNGDQIGFMFTGSGMVPVSLTVHTSSVLLADIASSVWAAGTRTLTTFGTLAADVWASATRTLTGFGSLATDAATAATQATTAATQSTNSAADALLARELLQADVTIDKSTTPWKLIHKRKGTSTVLLTQRLKDVDGTDLSATTTVVGQAVE